MSPHRALAYAGTMSNHPLYGTWYTMKQRCYNQNATSFGLYGGRGITVCDKWRNDFWAFVADVGDRPLGKTIDRIDNDGNYEPTNCRWATPKEQCATRRYDKQRLRKQRGEFTEAEREHFRACARKATIARTERQRLFGLTEKELARNRAAGVLGNESRWSQSR